MRSTSTSSGLFTKLYALSFLLIVVLGSVPAIAVGIDRTGLVYCPLQEKWVPPTAAETRARLDLSDFCVRPGLKQKFAALTKLSPVDEAALFHFLSPSDVPRHDERDVPAPPSNSVAAATGSHTANFQYNAIRAAIVADAGFVIELSVKVAEQTSAYRQAEYFTSAHLRRGTLRGPPLS